MSDKLTFKNNHPEGRFRSFGHIYTDIKLGGKQVGAICYSSRDNAMTVLLHVRHAANFRNVVLKKKFPVSMNERNAINEARAWLQENWPAITEHYELYALE